MRRRAVMLAGLAGAVASPARAETGTLAVSEPAGATAAPMPIHYHRPPGWRPGGPVVAVLHGVLRNGTAYRDAWVAQSVARGFLLLVPEFCAEKFPGVAWYNFGHAGNDAGEVFPPERRVFAALDRAVAGARAQLGAGSGEFALYGHSAGAQFAHRYVLLGGGAASRVIIANAGWYTMPDPQVAFPYGLAGVWDGAALRAAFARRVVVLLGEADVDPNHAALRRNAHADRQGLHRLARGEAFFAAAAAQAAAMGAPFHWTLSTVPGVGHSNRGMAAAAGPFLLG